MRECIWILTFLVLYRPWMAFLQHLQPWDSVDLGEGVSGPKAKKSPKSLEKVSRGRPAPGSQKSEKSLEKGPKSLKITHFQSFWRLFGPFSRLFSDFWGPGAGRPRETFSRLFGDFLAFGPKTPSPRPTESQLQPSSSASLADPPSLASSGSQDWTIVFC